MIVVSDSGPLISLMKAEQLDLLQKLYQEILIPQAVYQKLTSNDRYADEAVEISRSSFIRVVSVRERKAVEILRTVSGLDLGESEAIVYAYADETRADILLMEEEAGRRVAKSLGIRVRGSIGILLHGFDRGILTADDVEQALAKMRIAKRRIAENLYQYACDYVRKPHPASQRDGQ